MLVDCNKQALPEEITCRITHSSDLSDKELLEDDSKSELLLNELLVYDLPSISRSFPRYSRSFCIESQPKVGKKSFFPCRPGYPSKEKKMAICSVPCAKFPYVWLLEALILKFPEIWEQKLFFRALPWEIHFPQHLYKKKMAVAQPRNEISLNQSGFTQTSAAWPKNREACLGPLSHVPCNLKVEYQYTNSNIAIANCSTMRNDMIRSIVQ